MVVFFHLPTPCFRVFPAHSRIMDAASKSSAGTTPRWRVEGRARSRRTKLFVLIATVERNEGIFDKVVDGSLCLEIPLETNWERR